MEKNVNLIKRVYEKYMKLYKALIYSYKTFR